MCKTWQLASVASANWGSAALAGLDEPHTKPHRKLKCAIWTTVFVSSKLPLNSRHLGQSACELENSEASEQPLCAVIGPKASTKSEKKVLSLEDKRC